MDTVCQDNKFIRHVCAGCRKSCVEQLCNFPVCIYDCLSKEVIQVAAANAIHKVAIKLTTGSLSLKRGKLLHELVVRRWAIAIYLIPDLAHLVLERTIVSFDHCLCCSVDIGHCTHNGLLVIRAGLLLVLLLGNLIDLRLDL